ncbi:MULTISPECIES: DUF2158 domain-containing protein [unclassified Massilia]|uniref:DUF2158 domain-containing protein n=1 Tax=unclassified Massilia TaxID=2609279 RepID=UPI00177F0E2F|nr:MULTISPECIES: DUF2158 domain-containing protein [unclassified Massilia]MBD8533066.1 DUF2158 domain-containing protein [Massilia sp. CFBP 13647]MBD8676426.1 DUF2158 domain-containing protein [Massilia sp. CFBP 13721]
MLMSSMVEMWMFEKGNKVRRKGSGTIMTVRRVGNFSPVAANGVDCVWMDDKRKRYSAVFDAAELEQVSAAQERRQLQGVRLQPGGVGRLRRTGATEHE